MGVWVGWEEEKETIGMRCGLFGLGGWVEEKEAVGMRCWTLWVGGWVGGRVFT